MTRKERTMVVFTVLGVLTAANVVAISVMVALDMRREREELARDREDKEVAWLEALWEIS
jgi:hypothetical protein